MYLEPQTTRNQWWFGGFPVCNQTCYALHNRETTMVPSRSAAPPLASMIVLRLLRRPVEKGRGIREMLGSESFFSGSGLSRICRGHIYVGPPSYKLVYKTH